MPEIYKNGRLYGSGNSGASDYDDLADHPSINNEEVVGDKTSADYGLASTSDLAGKADGAGLTFSVDQRGMVNVTNDSTPTPSYDLPAGGTTGQVLKKASDDDDDVEWANDSYSLPTASTDTLGGIKVDGAVFDVDENGFLTQLGGGAGGGHTILDNGIPMGQRGNLDFIDHDLEDDDTDDITKVLPHRLTSEELDEIMSTLPGTPTDLPVLFDERGTEYQVGWYVNSNGLKKPLYQRGFVKTLSSGNDNKIDTLILSDTHITPINIYGGAKRNTDGSLFMLPYGQAYNQAGVAKWNISFFQDYQGNLYMRLSKDNAEPNVTYECNITIQYTKTTDTPQ